MNTEHRVELVIDGTACGVLRGTLKDDDGDHRFRSEMELLLLLKRYAGPPSAEPVWKERELR